MGKNYFINKCIGLHKCYSCEGGILREFCNQLTMFMVAIIVERGVAVYAHRLKWALDRGLGKALRTI